MRAVFGFASRLQQSIDLAPAEGGRVGQIISSHHDDANREILADSLAEFLEHSAASFE